MKTIVFEGMQHQFPDDATDDEIRAVLEQMHPAPAADAPRRTLDERMEERAALQQQHDELTKQAQSLEETMVSMGPGNEGDFPGAIDALRREQAQLKARIDKLGVGQTGRMVGSTIGGIAGSIGGGAAGSAVAPGVGTAAGSVAGSLGGTALGSYLGSKFDIARAEDITEEEADRLISGRMVEDVVTDAAGNLLFFVGGRLLRLMPGASDTAANALKAKAEKLAKLTTDPQRRHAVRELVKRTEGKAMPTPGQITEEAGMLESAARRAKNPMFEKSEQKMMEATEQARQELIRPEGQGGRKAFGQGVLKTLEDVEKSVKERTGKVFDKVQGAQGTVNMQGVLDAIDNTLATDLASKQRLLSGAERADLENLRRLLSPDDFAPPESAIVGADGLPFSMGDMAPPQAVMQLKDAMNFISGNKARLRSVNPDGKAGNAYTALITRINKAADDEAKAAIQKASPALRAELEGARADYREMMETVYDDASKAALKAVPEDILQKFVQTGNVTEIEQYQRLLTIAQREGKMSAEEVTKANQRLARGFLSGAAKDPEALANWSRRLDADDKLRETWNAIAEAPGGAELKAAMGVLEQMAQVAGGMKMTTGGQFIPLSRATHGGMGYSMVTGAIHPGFVLTGIGLTGATKALATMYTQGNKGVLNHMMRALRATQAGTPAALEGARGAFQAISKWAAQSGEEDPFVYEEVK